MARGRPATRRLRGEPPGARRWRWASMRAAALAWLLVAALVFVPPTEGQAARAIIQAVTTVDPLESLPGTSGSLEMVLTNVGAVTGFQITLQAVSVEGIVINTTQRVDVGSLGPGATNVVRPFGFWVPASTPPGLYPVQIELRYFYMDGAVLAGDGVTFSVVFKVRSPTPLEVGPLTGGDLRPGGSAEYTLGLRNTGAATLVSIRGNWSETTGRILPLGRGNEFRLDRLGPGAATDLPVQLAAPNSAATGIVPIRVIFTYTDTTGTAGSTASTFAVQIRAPSQLRVGLDEWTSDELTLTVSNVGIGIANAVEVRISPDGPVSTRPAAAVFLGNMRPGDHTTATFSPASPSGADEPLVVQIAYTDVDGVRNEEFVQLDLGARPGGEDNGIPGPAMAVVAVALLLSALRRRPCP